MTADTASTSTETNQPAPTTHQGILDWVNEVAKLTQPDSTWTLDLKNGAGAVQQGAQGVEPALRGGQRDAEVADVEQQGSEAVNESGAPERAARTVPI